ncbi:uncharacterized protein LOC144614805 isoform X2 [Panthera onca]
MVITLDAVSNVMSALEMVCKICQLISILWVLQTSTVLKRLIPVAKKERRERKKKENNVSKNRSKENKQDHVKILFPVSFNLHLKIKYHSRQKSF